MKLSLIDCAIAPDGGSIALSFTTDTNEEYQVLLDRGIDSSTRNKFFTSKHGKSPLQLKQENKLLAHLESAHIAETGCEELLQFVVSEIKNRQQSELKLE